MNFWKCILGGVCLSAAWGMNAQTLVDGTSQARAEIIVSADAARPEKFAAEELQRWIEKITGAILPIEQIPSKSPWFPTKIFLGAKFAGKFKDDLAFLKGSDGYAVRREGRNLYIFGSEPKGTLNGVYAFLEKNTDIIWARGAKFGTVFTPKDSLTVSKADWRDKPVFTLRGWWICVTHYHEQTEYWNACLGCNVMPATIFSNDFIYNRARDCGMRIDPVSGHNLSRFMPKKYFQEHPEYFCMIDGKRRSDVTQNQLCFSNLAGASVVAEEAAEQIAKERYHPDSYSIKTHDNWNVCECPECRKDICLPDGKVSRFKDVNFRSNQFFLYMNRAAELLEKKYPDLRINTFAYIFTAPAPDVKVAENLNIIFCPFVKNDKFSILQPANREWKERIDRWAKVSKNVVWREYYGCASKFPRPLADVAAVDLRYISRELGLHQAYAEYIPDWNTKNSSCAYSWDVSAMEFWVISKLYWNPYQDVEALRNEYLNRTYQKAAPAMKKYYGLIRKAWYDDPMQSVYNDNEYKSAVHYICGKGLEKPCREALEEAAKQANQPNIRKMVGLQRERFEDWMKNASLYMNPELSVPYVVDAAEAQTPRSPLWEKSASLKALKVMNHPKLDPRHPTEINLMHDRRNLYVKYECRDDKIGDAYAQKYLDGREVWPKGDHIELFLDGDQQGKNYYQFAADCNGNQYDGRAYDSKWNSSWKMLHGKTKEDYWVICAIPLKDIGVNLSMNNRLKGLFYRQYSHNGKDGQEEHSSWNGGAVHQPAGFGDLVLQME